MTALCSLLDIRKSYGKRLILTDVGLDLEAGQCVVLTGANGSGKTTLLKILAGLLAPDAGLVRFGNSLRGWYWQRGRLKQTSVYLHQHTYLFDTTVEKNLAFGLGWRSGQPANRARLRDALAWAGLEDLAQVPAATLSGGERQRAALARASVRQPPAMLLDEPLTNMDTASRERTRFLLRQLKHQGVALVISSHDPAELGLIGDLRWHLEGGRISILPPIRPATISRPPEAPGALAPLRGQA